jgi:L-ascorbate metabolism protein UlaG (beta-lactamase superfamily)
MSGKLRWLGVAFVEFTTADDKVILFDPWTKTRGNPSCPYEDEEIKQADLVLVSHDHEDHVGSATTICKNTGALIGGGVETMQRLVDEEGLNKDQVVNDGLGYLVGGGVDLGWVKVVATPAYHTSNTSCPMGIIVQAADGTTVYHAGDTSLTAEMGIYARLYPLNVAILPIFGIGTMDGIQAVEAVRMMKPKQVMPVHHDFCSDPDKVLNDFIELCRQRVPEVKIIKPIPGESMDI